MAELNTTDIDGMKIFYTDPSGKYRLVQFPSDPNNMEIIVFRGIGTNDETQTESTLTRRCQGIVLVDGVEKRCEILENGNMVEIPPARGRVKRFGSEEEFREYFKSLKIDETNSEVAVRTGWFSIPCFVTSIESGLFKIVEFASRDKMAESVKDAESYRTMLKEFRTDIINHFKSIRNV